MVIISKLISNIQNVFYAGTVHADSASHHTSQARLGGSEPAHSTARLIDITIHDTDAIYVTAYKIQ
jgi:hypothetical protein